MRALSPTLRKQLERAVVAARRASESGSRSALEGIGVFADSRPEHVQGEAIGLRKGLRAKWRQLGNSQELLVSECAYEQWHRLLFARFLAENDLLLHPQYKAPVSLADCEDLAAEMDEPDGWSVAARFAAEILPGIFRIEDPCVRLRLAPEGRDALERILAGIPAEVFQADDALGWVYQFWQRDKKDEVNASERKVGGADLGPVTQLFTENYMVRFLLENTLGAWWASRHPDSPLVKAFDYLRFDEDEHPVAGPFEEWPDAVGELTVMDPCCGSGHFLVEAFSMLSDMRAEEEDLDIVTAQDAVLRDNLFGLELDSRCVQIAMFAIALHAWKHGSGWRVLPTPHIACSGIPVRASADEWKQLARGDERLEHALGRLHILFRHADTLGSLIDPKRTVELTDPTHLQRSLEEVDWEEIAPIAARALQDESDPATEVLGADAAGLARVASFLSGSYTLIVTNVPYLGMNRQGKLLFEFCERQFPLSKADLATVFVERSLKWARFGTLATVLPQNWLYLASYKKFRKQLLESNRLRVLAKLGPGAFSTISGEVVQPVLTVIDGARPSATWDSACVDVSKFGGGGNKADALKTTHFLEVKQSTFLKMPDYRIVPELPLDHPLLEEQADAYWGIGTGDGERFQRVFWEVIPDSDLWSPLHRTFTGTDYYKGLTGVIRWEKGAGPIQRESSELGNRPTRGSEAWGKRGVAINQTGNLAASLYSGEIFQNGVAAVIPKKPDLLPALWAFCSSQEYRDAVRLIDPKIAVTNATLVKVPFDLERWRKVAEDTPLPAPWTNDPTQWLFDGRPEGSTAPLQVGVGRLLGYSWPKQPPTDDLEALTDPDGIVCLPSVAGEPPAAGRLQQLLAAAFGQLWSPAKAKELLEQSGSKKASLSEWLRDEFFKQHCALFGNRPFVWHIWDGLRDGFSALVNFHRLDRKRLEKLTYTYLGQDWVERQKAGVRDEVPGAEGRLSAATGLQRKLELILEGEKTFDIYARWKAIHEQPIGWAPDLDDGVRLNIRPFVKAGVLRSPFNIHWKKDRGKNPDGSERNNDVHLSIAEKREARKEADLP